MNSMAVRSLCHCPKSPGLHRQVTCGFLSRQHNFTSSNYLGPQSNHLCQRNASMRVHNYLNSQTFRSSSCFQQSFSVLRRKCVKQNSVCKGTQLTRNMKSFNNDFYECDKPWSTILGKSTCRTSFSNQRRQMNSPGIPQAAGFSTSVCCMNEWNNERTKPPWRVLFFGSDRFSLVALKALNENLLQAGSKFKVVDRLEVVCPVAKTPVKTYCQDMGLTIHQWPVTVDPGEFDVGVLSSFGKMIPARLLNAFPYGIINIHPSLLPRWRGAAPIPHTILSGDKNTGVSIMELRPKHFDTGPILLQKAIPVPEGSTSFQLYDLLAKLGVHLVMKALCDLPTLERQEFEQTSNGVTLGEVYEPLVQKLYNVTCSTQIIPGRTFFLKQQNCLLIKCKDGWVGFHKIGVKKVLTAKAFYNGFLNQPGSVHHRFESQRNTLKTYHTSRDIPKVSATV
ncbi:methionyl-tRNA formyltransferase, mitochondrial-like [Argopecten irradians]|uniref:methionyl-tRNA formyltransferase, mitochondrial-like n=1 Tax=Argopecten irradians TaxID=31199 RepID=UPI00371856F6